jgi:serine/threonine protein kinase
VKSCTTCGAEWPDDTKFCPRDGSPLRVAEGSSLIGSIVADTYHILKKLGEGGMGAVYLGEHVKMGRKSAIKVLTQSLAQDNEAIARFNREASNAARINHPNVCAIYDFGETKEGLIFLAMEYIEGESLTDLVQREGPLGPYRAADIVRQAGSALQAAHDLGIVHRDLKPDNIMITRARDGADMVKVVDFGIAKAMGGEEGQKVTRTGLVVGTPEYMSPEQLSGDKLDGRSDTYSLALVLFKMLTGRLPFEADNAQEMMIKRLTDEPLRLNDAVTGANFPQRLQIVMDRALQRMPSDRHASAEEFTRDAVQAVQGAAAAPVDTESVTQRLSVTPGRAATAPLEQTRPPGSKPTVPLTQGPPRGPRTPETPLPQTVLSRRPKKRKPVVAIAGSLVVVAVGVGVAAVAINGGGEQAAYLENSQPTADNDITTPGDSGEPAADLGTPAQIPATGSSDSGGGTEPETEAPLTRSDETRDLERGGGATAADSMAVENEINGIIERIMELDAQTAQRARGDARTLFEDPRTTRIQQAQLAYMLAQSYYLEAVSDSACIWIRSALARAPSNTQYQRFQQSNCAP